MENAEVFGSSCHLAGNLLAGGVYGIISLVRATPSAPVDGPVDSEVTAPLEEETEIDTTVSSLDQLRALLLREEDLVVTVDIDLEVSESLLVVGNKTVQGQGTLTAPLSLDEKIAIFDVTENAHLTLQGLSLDGNTNADGVNVRRNGKLSYLSGKIIYPAQYGIAVYGEAEIETADIQYAPTAAVFAGRR